jgi:hypothetical protein
MENKFDFFCEELFFQKRIKTNYKERYLISKVYQKVAVKKKLVHFLVCVTCGLVLDCTKAIAAIQ